MNVQIGTLKSPRGDECPPPPSVNINFLPKAHTPPSGRMGEADARAPGKVNIASKNFDVLRQTLTNGEVVLKLPSYLCHAKKKAKKKLGSLGLRLINYFAQEGYQPIDTHIIQTLTSTAQ